MYLWDFLDFHMFEQNSALAHQACNMVTLLDREIPFHVSMLLSKHFSLVNQFKFTIEAG